MPWNGVFRGEWGDLAKRHVQNITHTPQNYRMKNEKRQKHPTESRRGALQKNRKEEIPPQIIPQPLRVPLSCSHTEKHMATTECLG